MELVLHELYDGVEQIGHKPGDEEGQKYARETVDDEVCGENCQCDECPANELVECYWFLHELCCFVSLFGWLWGKQIGALCASCHKLFANVGKMHK